MRSLRLPFLLVMVLFAAAPLYGLLKISVSPPGEVMTAHPTLVPHGLTWRHWQRVLDSGQIGAPLRKSLLVAAGVTALALLLAGPAAYSLVQLPLRWRYGVLTGLFLCRMLPEVSVAMPIAVVFLRWGLMDTALGLTLAHLPMALPVAAWVLTTAFGNIPRDVGNLSVLGYDPTLYYTGRSPLEAASIGVALGEADVAVRCNLVTFRRRRDRILMEDHSAGHITDDEAGAMIESLKKEIDDDEFSLSQGTGYRHLLLWRGGSADIRTTPPHDIPGSEIEPWLPSGNGAEKLLGLMKKSREILKDHPVNAERRASGKNTADSIWLWGQGTRPEMPAFRELYGITGSITSAVDLVKGIGKFAGMEVIEVPGATGYLDTNYAGKVSGALESLSRVDLAMIHIEATDETGHLGDAGLKVRAIEDFDGKVVGPVLEGIREFGEYRVLVTSDHPTPVDVRTHVNEPVPFAILDSSDESVRDGSLVYTEDCAGSTGVCAEEGWRLMGTLVSETRR